MHPLTNEDIDTFFYEIPGYQKVTTHDTLPAKPTGFSVVNYDKLGGAGTHWVCYFNDPRSKYIEYFDSFGLPPSETIKIFLRKSGKPIQYNDSTLQQKNSVLCGPYCVYYLSERLKGRSPYDILYTFKQLPSS